MTQIFVGLKERLVEHGTSIRCGWLTDDGRKLLGALKSCSVDEIDDAGGTAYNGVDYMS